MATKESKRQVRELIEALELRAHRGPPVQPLEIQSVKTYLRQNDFSPASDYFARLTDLEVRLRGRVQALPVPETKRNYGGEAAGYQMQVQSVYDHVILSTCYQGEFNGNRGRVKISHRFNREGRIDFVELKYLRSTHPALNGELRKLLLVNHYQSIRKDWLEAEASVLRILPQELIFLYPDIFRCERMDLFAWLINIGHGLLGDLLKELRQSRNGKATNGSPAPYAIAAHGREAVGAAVLEGAPAGVLTAETWRPNPAETNGAGAPLEPQAPPSQYPGQLPLPRLTEDRVALPILEKAVLLEAIVEPLAAPEVLVRYVRRNSGA